MHKVLIVIDKHGWSYDTIARGLVKHNPNPDLAFDIVAVNEEPEFIERHHAQYDLVFAIGWTLIMSKKPKHHYHDLLPFLDRAKLITGIHSHRSWDDYRSLPDAQPAPTGELVQRLAKLRGINIISRRLFKIFSEAGLSNIVLTENGVDATLFAPTRPVNTDRQTPLVIGFSGSTHISRSRSSAAKANIRSSAKTCHRCTTRPTSTSVPRRPKDFPRVSSRRPHAVGA